MKRNIKIKSFMYLLTAAIVLVGLSSSPCLADLYDGSISGPLSGGDIIATDGWDSPKTKIEWTVLEPGTGTGQSGGNYYTYSYTFTVPEKEISHFILQVSDTWDNWGVDESGFVEGTLVATPKEIFLSEDATNYGDSGSNPGIPGNIHGLKFEVPKGVDYTTWEWSFNSLREPVWGDFYAKDGTDQQGTIDVYAYNSGFEYEPYDWYDQNNNLYNYDYYGYIATPDTTMIPVPGAVLLGIFGLGVAGIKLRKFT